MTLAVANPSRRVASGAVTVGTNATAANTGFTSINLSSGGTNGSAVYESDGVLFTSAASVNNNTTGRLNLPAANATAAVRYRYKDRNPSINGFAIIALRDASGRQLTIRRDSAAARLLFQDDTNTFVPSGSSPFATALVPGDYYELALEAAANTTTAANGALVAALYRLTAGTEQSGTWTQVNSDYVRNSSGSFYNLGANPFVSVDVGLVDGQASTGAETWKVCNLQVDDGQTTRISSYVAAANVKPTLTITTAEQSVAASTAVTIAATATDSDGTIASLTAATVCLWPAGVTAPSGSGSPSGIGTASASLSHQFTPTIPGLYETTFNTTDNSGEAPTAGASKRQTWVTAPAGNDMLVRDVALGTSGWTTVGTTDPADAIASGADLSKYLESGNNPAGTSPLLTLGPLKSAQLNFWLTSAYAVGQTYFTPQLRKNDGVTPIHTNTKYALPSTPSEWKSEDLTGPELATIPTDLDTKALTIHLNATTS